MRTIVDTLIRRRKAVLLAFLILSLVCGVLFGLVQVNYDLTAYLPEGSMTKSAVSEMRESFGYYGSARVMVEGVTIPEALAAKARIQAVDGVRAVLWLDDVADALQPLAAQDSATVNAYYRDGAALFQVTFDEDDFATSTGEAIAGIRALGIEGLSLSGSAEESRNMRGVLSSEIGAIFIVVVPFCLLVLFFASSAWVEPLLYLLVLLVSIVLNMGTNAFLPNVSFITHAMAAVLQLAVSLDYSLFLFHRYLEERDAGKDARAAVVSATAQSLRSVLSSALTTVAGFLALTLMRYSIGKDVGIVLAKGIALSLFTVMTLMPVLIYSMRNIIDKTRHRRFMPSFARLGRGMIKLRWVFIALLVLVIVPAYLASGQNSYLYGATSGSAQGDTAPERLAIEARFGVNSPVALLVPTGDIPREAELASALQKLPGVQSVQAISTLVDPALPREMLPTALLSQFESETYSRIVVNLAFSGEGDAMTQTAQAIEAEAERFYPGAWLAAGEPTSLEDIRGSVAQDGARVTGLSILAVALIVALAFKSISVPVLLVALIEGAVLLNMAVPYFTGTPLVYIGYLMISSLQLGATIDYAILTTDRYLGARQSLPPKEAAVSALCAAGPSVLVSTLILSGAGFAEALLSGVPSISAIGLLLGRGALLSGLLVLLVLPPLLALLDRGLRAGTWKSKAK
ncbi:MAG: MMPL family transporter [Oscillospiraceae bacterium]|jgi:predicted RND superfamily exporter protein|nr:MMPL family transporter [Oscillospiraceae bacterium]